MQTLYLSDGIIPDKSRQSVINCLISLTGQLPSRIIEHRIYLRNNSPNQTYLSRFPSSLPKIPTEGSDPASTTDVRDSVWTLNQVREQIRGRDGPQDDTFSIFSYNHYTIQFGDPLEFLGNLGYHVDYEMVRMGIRFEHPKGSRITIYAPFRLERPLDLSSLQLVVPSRPRMPQGWLGNPVPRPISGRPSSYPLPSSSSSFAPPPSSSSSSSSLYSAMSMMNTLPGAPAAPPPHLSQPLPPSTPPPPPSPSPSSSTTPPPPPPLLLHWFVEATNAVVPERSAAGAEHQRDIVLSLHPLASLSKRKRRGRYG